MKIINWRSLFSGNFMSEEERFSSVFQPLAYDPESGMFLCKGSCGGFVFECDPLCYEDERILERLKGFLNDDYPPGSMLQFCLYRSPDIDLEMLSMKALRRNWQNELLQETVSERIRFIKSHTRNRLQSGSYDCGIVHTAKLLIVIKSPLQKDIPSQDEMGRLVVQADRIQAHLKNAGLSPRKMNADDYLRFMRTIINRSSHASWRNNAGKNIFQKDRLLCEQIADADIHLKVHRDYLHLGRKNYIRVLSARRLPEAVFPGAALSYAGDILTGLSTVRCNYLVVMNIYYPDGEKTRQKLERKRQFAVQQAMGPILKFVPVLARKKQGFDCISESLQNGFRPVKISYSIGLLSSLKSELNDYTAALKNIWREQRFELMEDDCCQLPSFMNILPLGCDHRSVQDLFLFFTVTTDMAAPLLPVMGEWKGTGTFHAALFSRSGQLMSVSLHDSQTNKNAVIAAESGAGKSFFANELLFSYLSEGAQIWVIDAGKSYKKMAQVLKGDFLQFGEDSTIGLNPFLLVKDYEEDEDALVSLLQNMASQKDSLDEFQKSSLRRIMHSVWNQHRTETTVDLIREECLKSPDRRIADMGAQLYPFSSQGAYGRYFNSPRTTGFDGQFTVLELDELNGRRHLRQVVLLQLIYQIQQQVFLGDRSRRKIVMIDEAWDLLKDGDAACFLEHAYRKFRKYGGSAIIATQSINDLYSTAAGQAITENSATMFLLGQNPEAVESARRAGRLTLSPGACELLKTVHTVSGAFSEIFIKSEQGVGVGRLIVPEFQKLLYSTTPEDVQEISFFEKQGLSITQAIRAVLKKRNLISASYESCDEAILPGEEEYLPWCQAEENRREEPREFSSQNEKEPQVPPLENEP